MRFLAALPLALMPLASAASVPPTSVPRQGEIVLTPPAHCTLEGQVQRTDAPGMVEARRLDQLPPGRLDLAVMREVGGCPQPVTIREGYGAFGERASKPVSVPAAPRVRLLGR
jgi:hypothetical protein